MTTTFVTLNQKCLTKLVRKMPLKKILIPQLII